MTWSICRKITNKSSRSGTIRGGLFCLCISDRIASPQIAPYTRIVCRYRHMQIYILWLFGKRCRRALKLAPAMLICGGYGAHGIGIPPHAHNRHKTQCSTFYSISGAALSLLEYAVFLWHRFTSILYHFSGGFRFVV